MKTKLSRLLLLPSLLLAACGAVCPPRTDPPKPQPPAALMSSPLPEPGHFRKSLNTTLGISPQPSTETPTSATDSSTN